MYVAELDATDVPAGYTIRSYRPGVDDVGFLTHPDLSPYTALELVPTPGTGITAPPAQTIVAIRLSLGQKAQALEDLRRISSLVEADEPLAHKAQAKITALTQR